MNTETTIAAISTAQGSGGIAVIRISGDKATTIADKIFVPVRDKMPSKMLGYTCAFGYIFNNNEKIDEVVLSVFKAPHSYTGEDVVEISCHGGVFLTSQILRTVIENGATPAQAGEFTKRAFLNGKIDLTQAEAVMELISAKSRTAVRTALNLKDGALYRSISNIKDNLLNLAAHLNAWADYPEEDIAEVSTDELTTGLSNAERLLTELLQNFDKGQAVIEGVDTVIVGKPNVGKSTLMNLLVGREKSIVTDIAGTTRDVIEEVISVGNIILRLSDTAGIRDTDNTVEKIGVELARKKLSTARLVLAVFDAGCSLDKEDLELLDELQNAPSIAIINKTDLQIKADVDYIRSKAKNIVSISAKNNTGLTELTEIIEKIVGTNDFDPSQAILANERQRNSASNALKSVKEGLSALQIGMTFDAVTVTIEDAIDSLLELTGERTSDAVIDKVFHNFCVGK